MKCKPRIDFEKVVKSVVEDVIIDNQHTSDAVREAYLLGIVDGSCNQELADYAIKKITEK